MARTLRYKKVQVTVTDPPPRPPSILDKAFELLGAFSRDRRTMTLTELAQQAGLPKSTVHRLLERLVALDAVEHHEDGYAISLRFVSLGATAPASMARDLAMPFLVALNRDTGCTVHFGVLRGAEVFCLEVLPGERFGEPLASEHRRLPTLRTPLGLALLAWATDAVVDELLGIPDAATTHAPSTVSSQHVMTRERLLSIHEAGYVVGPVAEHVRRSAVAAPVVLDTSAAAALQLTLPEDARATERVVADVMSTSSAIADEYRRGIAEGRVRFYPPDHESAYLRR